MIRVSATIPLQHDTVYSPFEAAEFDEGLKWLRQDGFDGLEICITDPRAVDAKALKGKLTSFGMSISTISTGQAVSIEGLSLTDSAYEVRQKAMNRLMDHIALAAQIGCPNVTVGLIRGFGKKDFVQHDLELLFDSIFACASYGQEYGINLIIEPLNKAETNILTNVTETIDFLKQLQNPANVGVLLDTYHSNIEDGGIESAVERLGSRLFHVHFSDSNRGLPGTGSINYSSVAAALVKNQFNGFVSLEVKNIPDKATVIKDGYQSMARYIKNRGN